MAKLIAATWFPRSYIHLPETYENLKKLSLKTSNAKLDEAVSFDIEGFRSYPRIKFTQEWSGIHYLVAEVADEEAKTTSKKFLGDMQYLLLEEILKVCHTVSYRQIMSNVFPLDFHLIILSKKGFEVKDMKETKAGKLTVYYNAKDMYTTGNMTCVFGSEDESMMEALLHHAYVEVTADFMAAMMKKMIRYYHEASSSVTTIKEADDLAKLKKQMQVLDDIIRESSESYGKIKQAVSNFGQKYQEYRSIKPGGVSAELSEALGIGESFRKLQVDGNYILTLWSDVLIEYVKNINSTLGSKLMLQQMTKKKGWFS